MRVKVTAQSWMNKKQFKYLTHPSSVPHRVRNNGHLGTGHRLALEKVTKFTML